MRRAEVENFLNLFEHIIRISIQAFMPCPKHDNFMRLYVSCVQLMFSLGMEREEVECSIRSAKLEYYNKRLVSRSLAQQRNMKEKKFEKFNFSYVPLYYSELLRPLSGFEIQWCTKQNIIFEQNKLLKNSQAHNSRAMEIFFFLLLLLLPLRSFHHPTRLNNNELS